LESLEASTDYTNQSIRVFALPASTPLKLLNKRISECRGLVALVGDQLRIRNKNWLWDAVGTLELDSTTVLTGGKIQSEKDELLHLGYVGGLGGFFGSPFYGRSAIPLTPSLFIRRNVSAVYGSFVVFRPVPVLAAGGLSGTDRETGFFGIDLCLRLRKNGHLVGWTPGMLATTQGPLRDPNLADGETCRRIAEENPELIADDPYYNPYLSLETEKYGEIASPGERNRF
jgi:hypothetical protein